MKRAIGISVVVLLALSIFFIDCTQEGVPKTHSPQTSKTSPETELTQFPSQTLKSENENLQFGVKYSVKVIHVVDGDTIDVKMPDGSIERLRILGVDTPEKNAGYNKPYEYDDITDLSYLAEWGKRAKDYAEEMLRGKTVEIEFDERAGIRGYYGRLLAYVYVDGQDFGEMLLKNGYARVYMGNFEKQDYYLRIQNETTAEKIGLWNYTPPEVNIVLVHYDACGDRSDAECLNDEYVVIQNKGSAVNLEDWTIEDEAGHYYVFPDVLIPAGSNVTVHTGRGENNITDLFWGSGKPIWNNDHDTAYLYNSEGMLVDFYSW